MNAEAITGRLWRVGALTINVDSESLTGRPTPPYVCLNGEWERLAALRPEDAEALATFLVAAAAVARGIERDRRTVQRIEVQARARMHVLTQQAEAGL